MGGFSGTGAIAGPGPIQVPQPKPRCIFIGRPTGIKA
jgi:hypothetical protein